MIDPRIDGALAAEPDMLRRQRATNATMARFRNRTCDWKTGTHCVRLAAFHLKAMGHRVPPVPRIRSALAAKRELTKRGFATLTGLMDSLVPRRAAPAFMLLGDIAAVSGTEGLDALFVCAGPHKLIGWREDADAMVLIDATLDQIDAAWAI